jgi:TonB family protein
MTRDSIDWASLGFSLLIHSLLIILISSGLLQSRARQVALITDVTLLDMRDGAGRAGEEEKTVGLEKTQEKVAEAIKKTAEKKESQKQETKPVDVKELLREIEKKKSALDLGVSKESLRNISDDTKVQEGLDAENYEGGEVVAGSEPSVTGELATRKYKKIEWQFPKKLPEETELAIEVTVMPSGIIKSVQLVRTSGYSELDRMALSQARKLEFDPLPPDAAAQDTAGILLFKFGAKK